MLVNEQDIVLEARVQVGLQAEMDDNWVMVAVDVGINSVEALEELAQKRWKCLREWNT